MILVDTNVLVALTDAREELFHRANADLLRLGREEFFTIGAVLTEVHWLLKDAYRRERAVLTMRRLNVHAVADDSDALWQNVFTWLQRYAEHEPDWTDAVLVGLCAQESRYRVWSYDKEFVTVWRKPDGGMIPMAVY